MWNQSTLLLLLSSLIFLNRTLALKSLGKPIKTQFLTFTKGDHTDTSYKKYDYSRITIMVAMSKNFTQEWLEFTKSKNVECQVVLGDKDVNRHRLWIPTYRSNMVKKWADFAVEKNLDGINIDIEHGIYGDQQKTGILHFVDELNQVMKLRIGPHAKLTYDVPYAPTTLACVTGRCLYWGKIAEKIDFLVQMAYDAQLRPLISSATDPYERVVRGYWLYINEYGVDPSKMIQAVPWYGPIYYCDRLHKNSFDVCHAELWKKYQIHATDGTNVNQSIFYWVNKGLEQGQPVVYDDYQRINKISVRDDEGGMRQVWFNNETSFNERFEACSFEAKGGGLSSWWAHSLDYETENLDVLEMNGKYWEVINNAVDKLDGLK